MEATATKTLTVNIDPVTNDGNVTGFAAGKRCLHVYGQTVNIEWVIGQPATGGAATFTNTTDPMTFSPAPPVSPVCASPATSATATDWTNSHVDDPGTSNRAFTKYKYSTSISWNNSTYPVDPAVVNDGPTGSGGGVDPCAVCGQT